MITREEFDSIIEKYASFKYVAAYVTYDEVPLKTLTCRTDNLWDAVQSVCEGIKPEFKDKVRIKISAGFDDWKMSKDIHKSIDSTVMNAVIELINTKNGGKQEEKPKKIPSIFLTEENTNK